MTLAAREDEGRHDLEVRDRRVNQPTLVYAIGVECTWLGPWDTTAFVADSPAFDAYRTLEGWVADADGVYVCPACLQPVTRMTAIELRRQIEVAQEHRRYLHEFIAWCRGRCYPKGSLQALRDFCADLGVTREVFLEPEQPWGDE